MNWYKIIKISTPLPNIDEEYPEDKYGRGLSTIDEMFTEENVKKFEEIHPNAKRLQGYGYYGIAYDTGESIVKLTLDETEEEMAKKIMNNQIKNKNIFPNIYNIKEFQAENDNIIYAIEMEKIKTLNENEKIIYNNIEELISENFDFPIYAWNEVYYKIKSQIEKKDLKENIKKQAIKILEQYIKLNKKLEKEDLHASDLHAGNIGWKNDQFVIIDLGQIG